MFLFDITIHSEGDQDIRVRQFRLLDYTVSNAIDRILSGLKHDRTRFHRVISTSTEVSLFDR